MIVRVLIALVVIGAAIGLAAFLHRETRGERRGGGDQELPNYQIVLSFVGSAYGLLLGLLVAFAVGHYSDVRHRAEDEAASLIALYDTVSVYPDDIRVSFRHDLVCYMRSIIVDDWPSMEQGNSTEAPRALAFGDKLRAETRGLPLGNGRESSAYGSAGSLITEASEARQNLLFFTEPEIPNAIWAVVYVGAFLIVFLIAMSYADRPRGRVVALGTVSVLVTVVIAVLAMLDRPFGIGVRVHPNEMHQAIELVSVDSEPGVLAPCGAAPRDQ